MKLVPVVLEGRIGIGEDVIELAYRMESVDIGCVAMVVLVLNETSEAIPFRDEFPKDAVLVHFLKRAVDISGFLENGAEA